jgi:type III restriction enzyme
LVPEIKLNLETKADDLANRWLQTHRVSIKSLSDERQEVYRQIREMSVHPLDVDLAKPVSRMQTTAVREADGTEMPLPTYERHLLCDENGLFPEQFNSWEDQVLLAELKRPGTVAWYRNPSRTSQDSLGITYEDAGAIKIVRPDFIFFAQTNNGVVADIVDPHGTQFGEALPKLQGLAKYAETNRSNYRRIEVVAKVDGRFRALDLTEPKVRSAIETARSIKELYESNIADDYLV